MKAMIFAAGMGTRLKPYTENMPKAMVPVAGVPMIEHVILRLKSFGITDIIVNVHHLAEQVILFLKQQKNFGLNISISLEKDLLLETGGGLMKASWFFNDNQPFLVHNVDVLSDINFGEMFSYHSGNNALATLAVSERTTSRYFLFNDSMRLCGWENSVRNEQILVPGFNQPLSRLAFSGIQIVDPHIFSLITQNGKFSIIDVYLQLAKEHLIQGYCHSPSGWVDMGKPDDLEKAESLLRYGGFNS